MTEEEAERKTAESKAAARREYEQRITPLVWTIPEVGEKPGDTPLSRMIEDLKDHTLNIKNHSTCPKPSFFGSRDFRLAMSIPNEYWWTEYSTEMTRDPISGNPTPKLTRVHEAHSISLQLIDLRAGVCAYVKALTALARKVGSPTYRELRSFYLGLREFQRKFGCLCPLTGDYVNELCDEVVRLTFELAADIEIAAFPIKGKGVRHG